MDAYAVKYIFGVNPISPFGNWKFNFGCVIIALSIVTFGVDPDVTFSIENVGV